MISLAGFLVELFLVRGQILLVLVVYGLSNLSRTAVLFWGEFDSNFK